jgi:hypothetical protein
MITHLLPDHVMGSLASVIGDRITAGSGIRWMLLADRLRADGSSRTICELLPGRGHGASGRRDGPSGRFFPIRARHTAVERFELDTGLTIERKALRQDRRSRPLSGQVRPGHHARESRPGHGALQLLPPADRHGARGYFGRHDGKPGHITLNGKELDRGCLDAAARRSGEPRNARRRGLRPSGRARHRGCHR